MRARATQSVCLAYSITKLNKIILTYYDQTKKSVKSFNANAKDFHFYIDEY